MAFLKSTYHLLRPAMTATLNCYATAVPMVVDRGNSTPLYLKP